MSTPKVDSGNDATAKLQTLLTSKAAGKHRFGGLRRWLIPVVILMIAVVAYFILRGDEQARMPNYQTSSVSTGNLVVKVSATGNLQPTNKVDVGSELSGIIETVLVDDNDQVKKGDVLARLDVSRLRDAVTNSRANLASAEAQVLLAQATVAEAQANLERMKQVAELSGGKVPSKSEMSTAEADLKRAQANEASARASVSQAKASLQSDQTNLSKASIRSPINGVVLSRQVETGQTVAASFQAPVLFTLAEDLTKMELQVDVDEADVGQVQIGQKATFSVDAWPNREYAATITRVGYGSEETDGVVSYPALLAVSNDDLSLRPGMTGTAEIITLTRENALLVPNAALRFIPPQTGSEQRKSGGSIIGALMPRPPRSPKTQSVANNNGDAQRVWVLRDGNAVPVEVQTGATDGRVTEITGGALEAGMDVITEIDDIGS